MHSAAASPASASDASASTGRPRNYDTTSLRPQGYSALLASARGAARKKLERYWCVDLVLCLVALMRSADSRAREHQHASLGHRPSRVDSHQIPQPDVPTLCEKAIAPPVRAGHRRKATVSRPRDSQNALPRRINPAASTPPHSQQANPAVSPRIHELALQSQCARRTLGA